MTVLAVNRDPVALTLTIVSEFGAPVARVWQVWADPRQLERWWGPPTYAATVVASIADMEQIIATGTAEGMALAVGHIDAILAEATRP